MGAGPAGPVAAGLNFSTPNLHKMWVWLKHLQDLLTSAKSQMDQTENVG